MSDIDTSRGAGRSWFRTLDDVLRGRYPGGDGDAAPVAPGGRLVGLGLLLGALCGAFLASYALLRGPDGSGRQVFAGALKVPLLFALTLLVTFPSLYVFAALQRLPLRCGALLRLMGVSILVHLCVTTSLAPVFAFFAASTDSYPFLLLLQIAFFAIGGGLGLMVLRGAARAVLAGPMAGGDGTRTVIGVWCVVYAVVGAQMGWLLRPFLGRPDLPFEWFRAPEGNFLLGVGAAIRSLFGT